MTDTRWQLLAYVFASIILSMVAAQLWRRRTSVGWVRLLSQGWAALIVRFVYYVGLPYAALILGVVPGRYLGLIGQDRRLANEAWLSVLESGANIWQLLSRLRDDLSLVLLGWLPDLGRLVGLATVMLVLLSVTWLGYSHYKRGVQAEGMEGWKGGRVEGWKSGRLEAGQGKGRSLVQVIYQAVHWSFYRSAIWLLTDDLYLGVVGGILLVAGEWMLAPRWAERVGQRLAWEELLMDASVLIATSVIFFFVPNLWLLLPVHWLLAMISRRIGYSAYPANHTA